ncbi:MAG: GNAT family N-acetyltransferase [Candidatus Eisenbacteria bacterium]|uniref:GNAT family N-acetyltransferase n=1 Tax=Eiseniibacteriota bacterium TaxID=2212470 RepID=A0A9D6L9T0_UNCEI|nr:GNAT family N-acetyltransferase [Candidatus Eisenbacteria bacterium]
MPQPRIGPVTADRLGPMDLTDVFAYLDRDPVLNVYLMALVLRDALAAPRDEYWAIRRDGAIDGLLHIGGQSGAVLPLGDDPAALRALADAARQRLAFMPRRFQVIGPRAAVEALVRAFARAGRMPRLERSQVYMALARGALPAFEWLPELSPARGEDAAAVYATGADLRLEELDEDPRLADPEGFRRRVDEECRDGHTYLWRDAEGLRFRASVSALTGDAAQVSGVYTPPGMRLRGYARRGLAELCARLLERCGAVCLFVNDFNAPALAVYRRLGFTTRAEWASAFYDVVR